MITIIAAMGKHKIIGHEGKIPWKSRADMNWFKSRTMGKTCIMGRKTYESIGKPLEGRRTIVLTSTPIDGVETAAKLSEALEKASGTDVMICGGARVYEEARELADEMLMTMVYPFENGQWSEIEGDAFFPFDPVEEFKYQNQAFWNVEVNDKETNSGTAVMFCILRRNEFEGSTPINK